MRNGQRLKLKAEERERRVNVDVARAGLRGGRLRVATFCICTLPPTGKTKLAMLG